MRPLFLCKTVGHRLQTRCVRHAGLLRVAMPGASDGPWSTARLGGIAVGGLSGVLPT